ncbi:MAG: gamma-glutamylcyclotransferase family protein [Anaerolineae bacterium]
MSMGSRTAERQLPFFVYGTLLPEQPNYYIWGDVIASEQPATLTGGALYDMGFYPMLVEEGDGQVRGLMVAVRPQDYAAVVTRLDYLEGFDPKRPEASDYRRVERMVRLDDGRMAAAWVYVGSRRYVQGRQVVPDGDWLAYMAARPEDQTNWWAGIDSVRGLHESTDE